MGDKQGLSVTGLAGDSLLAQRLPAGVRNSILTSTGSEFLQALTSAALVPECVERIFIHYNYLTPEIAARWIASCSQHSVSLRQRIVVLGCLARIFPLARCLRPMIKDFVANSKFEDVLTQETDQADLEALLLAMFRLISTEPDHFSDLVRPTFLSRFFSHDSCVVRYLAVQCMCIVMRFADALQENLVRSYVCESAIIGQWEGKEIDFRLLKIFEKKRWLDLDRSLKDALTTADDFSPAAVERFAHTDLSPATASIGGILVPRNSLSHDAPTNFINTPTATQNLRAVGRAFLDDRPILLIGPSGSGKSCLIRATASLMNNLSSMITLHLNEQTDAKSLLGIYTSSESGDSFTWKPGVLTKAVAEGRLVVIEDIDRAPSEVLGVLRPIIENGELFLPNRKEKIRPKEGFRVLATIKTSAKAEKGNTVKHGWLANERLWTAVEIQQYEWTEIRDLLRDRHPHIGQLLPDMMRAHDLVYKAHEEDPLFRASQSRLPSLRDLFKWCRRTNRRVKSQQFDPKSGGMLEHIKMDIFRDGVDCYAAHHSDSKVYSAITQQIAQALNIAPQQMEYSLLAGSLVMSETKYSINLGRSALSKVETRRSASVKRVTFAMTDQAKRTLDSIAAATSNFEPLLLVGETGIGKTTQVQYLADLVGQSLTVINLSQQSEAADLLGGLKPVSTRSLIIPLVDQFSTLFDDTFSNKRNEKFRVAISKAIAKDNWSRLMLLWREAVQMAEVSLKRPFETAEDGVEGQSVKRRKLVSKYGPLRDRWSEFSSKLNHIQAQVERRDKNHTFAFVEGKLVQAIRLGHWVLLDEINLASADTLEHIVGLLNNGDDERPSLLLAEAGNVEKIMASPSFRLFGAMNPATDAGKKNLLPDIRSRFTEIYVQSGDNNVDDLVKLINTYLGTILSSDKLAALDLAQAYLQLKQLNDEHKLTDGAGDIPHFSIRSLVRCLQYTILHNASYGLRRAMYEGFAMSFFTVLSIESENRASPLVMKHLLRNVKNVQSFLKQQPKVLLDETYYTRFENHFVLRGPEKPDLQPHYIQTPSVERNLKNLARAASMRRFPILLQGPTSVGKTSMVEYLAKRTGNRFVRINNHEHTDLQEYLGSYVTGDDGKLQFRHGVLVEAVKQGLWVVLDELNLAPSDVLEALNRLLDDNRELLIPETQEIIRPNPKFLLVATQNPSGLYGGRKPLSRAFRNRFLELHFDNIPEHELEAILLERAQIAPSFCSYIVQVYKDLSLQRQATRLFESGNSFATLRDLFRWAARPLDDKHQLAKHGFMLLAERVREPAERALVKNTIERIIGIKIDENELYGEEVVPEHVRMQSQVVWTPAMRRLFVLVTEALLSSEPVLLVGPTGCGKTQICQSVAQAFQRTLNIYNAHSNTETGDLIGSQRPIRQRSDLAHAVLDNFNHLYTANGAPRIVENQDIDELIASFDKMDTSALEPGIVEKTRQSIAAYRSLFAWSDGSLIRSMKSGDHFLLDEISLADDSVLERLNSLLEPARTILLAEKGSTENVVVAQETFKFLATMNPGGDYGKRELSNAMRSRLTEIWVPSLSEADDVLPILQVKLKPYDNLGQPLLGFATWFSNHMQTSAVSIRSLLAWVDFIQKNRSHSPDLGFVHGAFMVYIDSLGANPAGLTSATIGSVSAAREACLRALQTFTSVDVILQYKTLPHLDLNRDTLSVGQYSLPRQGTERTTEEIVFNAPTTLRNTMRIVRALQMNRPILLEGDPGVGKTAIVTAIAAAIGKSLIRINLSDQTDLMDLFGADVPTENESLGHFSWRDGSLLSSMKNGDWVLLDEMNLASQSVLEGLNSCLDHRQEVYIAELDKTFACSPEFTIFAAQNPHQQGSGRKGLPSSFVSRFTVVYMDPFERDDLLSIARHERSLTEDKLSLIINTIYASHNLIVRSPLFSNGGPWDMNLRDVFRWLDLAQEHRTLPPGHQFDCIVAQRFRSPAAREALSQIRDTILDRETELSLHHNLSPDVYQLGTSLLERDAHLQHVQTSGNIPTGQLSHAQSVITAINHVWPVVLVGPSGSGKTAMIRKLAALSGSKLVELSMNADTDIMDLLGGYEQYDSHRDVVLVQKRTCQILVTMICESIADQARSREIPDLLAAYENVSTANADPEVLLPIVELMAQRWENFKDIANILTVVNSKSSATHFVWNDGILIDCMREGSWVVLDNANLCNPSVLDRLNSLLEPHGSLIVSEQHSSGLGERVINPHKTFRIFLTVNPAQRELSRAIRNRSLEIFIELDKQASRHSGLPSYSNSAKIYRFASLLQMSEGVSAGQNLIEPSYGLLSETDSTLISSQIGHLIDDANVAESLQNCIENSAHMSRLRAWPEILPALTTSDGESKQGRILRSLEKPRLFLLDDALVRILVSASTFAGIRNGARQYFAESQRARLERMLLNASKTVVPTSRSKMSVLQQSILKQRSKDVIGLVPQAYSFLTNLVNTILKIDQFMSSEEAVTWFASAVSLATDMFKFFDQTRVDLGVFRAYLQIADDLAHNEPTHARDLRQKLGQALLVFEDRFVLRSGQSLYRMWPLWRPVTPATLSHLDAQIATENLIAKFDRFARSRPSQPRQELAAIRAQISRLRGSICEDNDANEMIATLTTAVEELVGQNSLEAPHHGHFASTFEWVLQKLILQGKNISELDFHHLSLLTRSLPMSLDQGSSIAGTLLRLAYLSSSRTHGPTAISSQILSDLNSVTLQPLSSLQSVQTELNELARTFALHTDGILANSARAIFDHSHQLLLGILTCHIDLFTLEAQSCFQSSDCFDIAGLARLGGSALSKYRVTQVGHFEDVYRSYLLPVITTFAQPRSLPLQSSGACLSIICVAALKLFVPDKTFDPAIYPTLVSQRYHARVSELKLQVDAYRTFQERLTGQKTSSIILLLEEELRGLGEAPLTSDVVRPLRSELDAIQQNFSIVLGSVLGSTSLQSVMKCVGSVPFNSDNVAEDCKVVQQLVSRVVDRLSRLNRAYDDIVKPVQWLLECLSLGAGLTSDSLKLSDTTTGTSILNATPLLGGKPSDIDVSLQAIVGKKNVDMRLLSHLQFCSQIEQGSQKPAFDTIDTFLRLADKFYVEWKTRLTKDQADAAAKSRYYAYRGEDEIANGVDAEELATLFPTYEVGKDDEIEPSQDLATYDARSVAVKLSKIHCKLYEKIIVADSLQDYVLEALSSTSAADSHALEMVQIFPGVLLRLEKSILEISRSEPAVGLNIYTDSDPIESRKLVDLVCLVKQRFGEIASQWPEHAVPVEVLNFSDELLAFRIDEPIAKLLTKTEKLLEIVGQWQSVASREWSVSNLTEALTSLIIHWRRLELSSWSRLLEIEKSKFEDDANSWYFIAYEAVLYNTRLVVDRNDNVTTYCQELAKTLEDFLKSTTLGQFANRLKLLRTLQNTLETMTLHDNRLAPITQCIAAVIYHYERCELHVQESLSTGRAKLQKDITEQIKLASWKDTNVQSLRDSARRTHYKLFKIVKKYRALLAQSLVFQQAELDQTQDTAALAAISPPEVDSDQLRYASNICSQTFTDWKARPERLTDPCGAATSMRRLYGARDVGLDMIYEIASLRKDISNTASELRKQTPQSLTEENAGLVRHLKERKRRLLADTIRNVTQMGVRRNLATTEISRQASASIVLASSFNVCTDTWSDVARGANAAFHELLDNMPAVRRAAVEHSEELTEGETRRAIGLLEGFLAVSISQRAELFVSAEEVKAFRSVLRHAQNLPIDTVTNLQRSVEYRRHWLQKCLAWLPPILETSCQILRFQSAHGDFDVSELIQALGEQATELEKARIELQELPELPKGLSTSASDNRVLVIEADLGLLGNLIRQWSVHQPKVAYLLDQIVPWTKPFGNPQPYTNGATGTELESLDIRLRRVLDSIFVAMQNVASLISQQPASIEEQGWLNKAHKLSAQSFKALHLRELSEDLSGIVSLLQHLPEHQLKQGVAVLKVATPVLEQYYAIAEYVHQYQLGLHCETSRLAVFLTKTFMSLANQGFCSPKEPSDGQQESGKLESGTGLGDGEGAEDISKDVGEDEDLSDLAQAQAEKQDQSEEIDKEKDAVDMGVDDLEGAMGSGDEDSDREDRASGSEDEDDMDEETGSVDNLDPSAVDEKLWDDMKNETDKEKDMKSDKQKGQKTDEQTAKEDNPEQEGDEERGDAEGSEDNGGDEDDDADGSRPEAENIDPHLQEQEALELPAEMQLNGEEEGKEDEDSDDGMDELSGLDGIDQPVPEQEKVVDEDMDRLDGEMDGEEKEADEDEDEGAEGKALDEDIVEDQPELGEEEQDAFNERDNEMQYDIDEQAGGDKGTANQRDKQYNQDQDENTAGQDEKEDVVDDQQTQAGKASDQEQTGDAGHGRMEQGVGKQAEDNAEQTDPIRSIADMLERYHQRREIFTQSEDRQQGQFDQDIDMADADFEHAGDNEQETDAQALGAASMDQVQKIDDSKAIEDESGSADQELPMPEDGMQESEHQETIVERFSRLQNQPRQANNEIGVLPQDSKYEKRLTQSAAEDDLSDADTDDHTLHDMQQQAISQQTTSTTDAAELWARCTTQTRSLSLLLTEQLRLILAPTTATRLRGDYRTGKRLNIKRIIPFIASGFKRDKIWMRRSVPSKRDYQVMIAVDDSKSMSESGADLLAFETLAMLCESLSMLEVGDLCVVGFGDQDNVRTAHPFGQPFTSDSGIGVFKTFSFQQRGTDVRKLLRQSIAMFEDARLRAPSRSDDLWQLQLIISDGHCSDHDAIRRLVRAAHEQKIMIVFVIVDAGKESIVDLLEAKVEKVDPLDKKSDTKVVTKRYLEGFPFGYYVVVRDVGDLPGVLARVLKGWFESVVNVG